MPLVNHLKSSDSKRRILGVAAGRHVVAGHLIYSYSTGASPNHRVYVRQALGKGDWDGLDLVIYNGLVIPATDYIFHDGTQTESGAYFPQDNAHTGTVMVDALLPANSADADTNANPPTELVVIARTEKFPDFDASGNQIDALGAVAVTSANLLSGTPLDKTKFSYSPSPARVALGWMLKYGKIEFDRINWLKWTEWRNFCAGTETIDYTGLSDFDGFGLSARYYNGANFETFVVGRIDASVYFALSSGAPAAGVNADNFSARWEGFIKPEFTETYTFTLAHTTGGRLSIGGTVLIDQFAAAGTQTAAFAATANIYYPIVVEWQNGTGDAEIALKWTSASVPVEVIKPANLYPKTDTRPRYEAHVEFSTPTSLDQMIGSVLLATNSIRQEVGGRIEFYCSEQLAPSFHFDGNLPTTEQIFIPGSFTFSRSDVRVRERQNVFEAEFRDLDSQYLEKPENPVRIVAALLRELAGREIYGSIYPLANMTRWQARKVLQRIVNFAALKDLTVEFDATARAYQVISGDVVTLSHESGNFINKQFQVISAIDYSPDEKSDARHFKLQEL